jgi:hypothetical protein
LQKDKKMKQVGQYINAILLGGERAEYGKRIVSKLSTQLSWPKYTGFFLARFMTLLEKYVMPTSRKAISALPR